MGENLTVTLLFVGNADSATVVTGTHANGMETTNIDPVLAESFLQSLFAVVAAYDASRHHDA